MAIKATHALMHAGGGAVIRCSRLAESVGRMALRAEPLLRVRANPNSPISLEHWRDGQLVSRERCAFMADVEMGGLETRGRDMNLMAREARNGRLVGFGGVLEFPRAGGGERRHKVVDVF